jgi:dephospho-CoA kinase
VIASDEIVHQLLREDREAKEAVVERFGACVLGEDGEIDRSRVGELVFGNPAEFRWLEALLHPRVFAYSLDHPAQRLRQRARTSIQVGRQDRPRRHPRRHDRRSPLGLVAFRCPLLALSPRL